MEHETIIIASMGRCGTTLLLNSLFMSKVLMRDIENITNPEYTATSFVKTYDYPFLHKLASEKTVKAIYLFGNPYDIVLSSHNPEKVNISLHYDNLHSDFSKMNRFLKEDTLNLEKNFDLWMKPQKIPLLTLRYETMWQNLDIIRTFVGFKFDLPAYEKRINLRTKYSFYDLNILKKTYQTLADKVASAKDVEQWTIV